MAEKSFNVVERVSVYNPLYPFYAETSMRLKRGLKTDQDHANQASSFLHNVARRTSVCVCDPLYPCYAKADKKATSNNFHCLLGTRTVNQI